MPAVVKKSATASEAIQAETADLSAEVLADVDLSNAPKLTPYSALRVARRKAILAIADTDLGEKPTMTQSMDLLIQVDEALESVALDPAAYAEWATGDDAEARIMALFNQYAEQVGKSMRSAN